jgi:hypothetical protein
MGCVCQFEKSGYLDKLYEGAKKEASVPHHWTVKKTGNLWLNQGHAQIDAAPGLACQSRGLIGALRSECPNELDGKSLPGLW